jgi:hypothetical protein
MADSVRVTHDSLTKVAQLVTLPDSVPLGTGGATAAKQDTIIGHVDGIEGLLARTATGTKSTVNSGIASANILASNASRKGATITNTDANVLYLDLSGGTASSTSYSVAVASGGFYELPWPTYTGLITGIWAADGAGAALVTEFT